MENHNRETDRLHIGYWLNVVMENLSLNSALVFTLISIAAYLVLFLSIYSRETLHAEMSDSFGIKKDMDDTL